MQRHCPGHLYRANAGGVADTGAAIDQYVVVFPLEVLFYLFEQAGANLVKALPIKCVHALAVSWYLPASSDEVD